MHICPCSPIADELLTASLAHPTAPPWTNSHGLCQRPLLKPVMKKKEHRKRLTQPFLVYINTELYTNTELKTSTTASFPFEVTALQALEIHKEISIVSPSAPAKDTFFFLSNDVSTKITSAFIRLE